MSATVKVTIDKTKKLLKDIRALTKQELLVGVPAEESGRDGPIGNASLAYIHEKGSPARNIPARPFLEPGIEKVKDEVVTELGQGAANLMSGKSGSYTQSFNRSGIIAVNSVKRMITAGEGFAPLKPKTIEDRKSKGFKGEKPLIRTGQLRNTITYVIRPK